MRWLYKIWGGYDGFRPSAIPSRMSQGQVNLGWAKYADAVDEGDEVWVWFHEGQRFDPGVYLKGIVTSIDLVAKQVTLWAQDWDSAGSLTSSSENDLLAPIVSPKGRQVFYLPENFGRFEGCTATLSGAESCAERRCGSCTYWEKLPVIVRSHLRVPPLLDGRVKAFAPAYWVVGRRSFVWNDSQRQVDGVRRTSEMFYRFKTGEAALALPLARGMVKALTVRRALQADAIVPIPLSPEKIEAGEINRTMLLAQELRRLTGVPVVDGLRLTEPKGRRISIALGQSDGDFRQDYTALLKVDSSRLRGLRTIILVDDVCTWGNTARATIAALRRAGVDGDIVVSTAGQMTVRQAVTVDRAVLKTVDV